MPRLRRKGKARRTYGPGEITQLKHGWAWFGSIWGDGTRNRPWTLGNKEAAHADMREAWEVLRDQILSDWIIERPTTRPWSWWTFDCAEDRDQTIDEAEQLDRLGELTESERRHRITLDVEAVHNHIIPWQRPWGWWVMHGGRDYAKTQPAQLKELGELTDFENMFYDSHAANNP